MTDVSQNIPIIEVSGLSKCFHRGHRKTQALSDVSFTVPKGSVFTILGPNGAGKTTMLRIMTTVLHQDSGTVKIAGFDTLKQTLDVRQQLGIVAQGSYFDRYLTIWHNLFLHGEMHGLSKAECTSRISELLHKVGLYDRRDELPEILSGGQQRKVALIRALIHKPSVLFLDEPTTGLDPQARHEIWEAIADIRQEQGMTVILTTHYMDEADELSDEILFINSGKQVMQGTPDLLKKRISPENTYDFVFHTNVAHDYQTRLQDLGYAPVTVATPRHLTIKLTPQQKLQDVLSIMNWADIQKVAESEVDLEAVYLAVAKQHQQSEAAVN